MTPDVLVGGKLFIQILNSLLIWYMISIETTNKAIKKSFCVIDVIFCRDQMSCFIPKINSSSGTFFSLAFIFLLSIEEICPVWWHHYILLIQTSTFTFIGTDSDSDRKYSLQKWLELVYALPLILMSNSYNKLTIIPWVAFSKVKRFPILSVRTTVERESSCL